MVILTDYMRYRARLRGFDLNEIERILRFSEERYLDTSTGRRLAIGHHGNVLVAIPYEQSGEEITPITIHATNRHQVSSRIKAGRYIHE